MVIGRLKAQLFGSKPAAPVPFAEPPVLVLARRERRVGDNWFGASSYLGGLPKLGAAPWPVDETGKPLYFMGQLDCAEIDRASGGRSALPKSGALAFFIGGKKFGHILHIAAPGTVFTTAPQGRATPQDVGGSELIAHANVHGPKEFPFWPVELHAIHPEIAHVPGDCEDEEAAGDAQREAIEAEIGPRPRVLSIKSICEEAGLAEVPLYWHSALMFAERVPRMLDAVASAKTRGAKYIADSSGRLASLEAGLPPPKGQGPWSDPVKDRAHAENWIGIGKKTVAEAEANEAAIADYVVRVRAFMPPIDPWRAVTANDAARLDALFDEARSKALEDFSRFQLPRSWRDYAGDTIRLMMAGPDEAFSKLPSALRAAMHRHHRLPTGTAHLMFGLGDNIQGNAMFEYPDQRLVLQLTYDNILYWRLGDNGAYQFWMSIAALQSDDFSKAEATFECH